MASVNSRTVIPVPAALSEKIYVVAVVGAAEADVVGRPQHDGAVVDHLPVLVDERAVGDLARA